MFLFLMMKEMGLEVPVIPNEFKMTYKEIELVLELKHIVRK